MTARTICSTIIKIAALGGLFALAWKYDGTLLYLFAAAVGGTLGFDLGRFTGKNKK